ncbi:TolB family protein [Paenibacillus sp. GYB003]|uniref:TolB family protein n=1 Tax=Paenibacillus sp. GYB003 TaxID=2994392 RepID=UPI002F966BE0
MTLNTSAFELFNVIEAADRVHMSLSADLKWLAFCLNGESKGYSEGVSDTVQGNKQWVCELETGKLIQVAPQAMSSWAGVWSPDGKDLAFFADIDGVARLWIWSSSDQTLKLASKTKARNARRRRSRRSFFLFIFLRGNGRGQKNAFIFFNTKFPSNYRLYQYSFLGESLPRRHCNR